MALSYSQAGMCEDRRLISPAGIMTQTFEIGRFFSVPLVFVNTVLTMPLLPGYVLTIRHRGH